MEALELRVGDVVRLKPMKVDAACGETVNLVPLDPKSYKTECVWLDHIESIISRAETPEETIARLEAENAGLRNDVKAAEAAYEAELAKAKSTFKIDYAGDKCPVALHTQVVVWMKDGSQKLGPASDFWWHGPSRVCAYMVLPS